MSALLIWDRVGDSLRALDERGTFTVARHGEGRKYWGVSYPDGTYTHSALTQTEAKQQAESWAPDKSLVALSGIDDARDRDQSEVPDDEYRVEFANEPRQPALTVHAGVAGQATLTHELAESSSMTPAGAVSAIIDAAPAIKIQPNNPYSYNSHGKAQTRALQVLAALVELRAETEAAIRHQVQIARTNTGNSWNSNAATWEDVGKALGVTKQSAQARYK